MSFGYSGKAARAITAWLGRFATTTTTVVVVVTVTIVAAGASSLLVGSSRQGSKTARAYFDPERLGRSTFVELS